MDLMGIRRSLLMQMVEPKESYITDGLVFQLDGIDRGGVSGKWHDIVNGNDVTLTGQYTELTNGIYFPATQTPYGYGELTTKPNISRSDGTVEFVVQLDTVATTGRPVLSLGNNLIGASIAHDSDGNIVCRTACRSGTIVGWRFNELNQTKAIISINESVGVGNGGNGTQYSASQWSYSGPANGLIAGRGTGNPFKGTIYALRIYNRKLTSDEMIHNQKIDNKRYNFGLTI